MPFDTLIDALCDRCWAKEELYGGPLEEFEGLSGSYRFLAREGWLVTLDRMLCPRCKELPPMTYPSAPHTTAGSLSLRIQELEQASAGLADLQERLKNMTRERTEMAEQLANWDRSIQDVRERVKAGEQAATVLGQLHRNFEATLNRPPLTPRVPKPTSDLPRATHEQVREYLRYHAWSRASEIEVALNVRPKTVGSVLSRLVKGGEAQVVQGRYAEASLPPITPEPRDLTERDRLRVHIAAHPDQTALEILQALGMNSRSSNQITRLIGRGEVTRVDGRHRITAQGRERLPVAVPAVAAPTVDVPPPAAPAAVPVPAAPTVQLPAGPAEVPAAPPQQDRPAAALTPPAPTQDAVQEQVLAYLGNRVGLGFRATLIADVCGCPLELVKVALRNLVQAGQVTMRPGGWYGLEGDKPDEVAVAELPIDEELEVAQGAEPLAAEDESEPGVGPAEVAPVVPIPKPEAEVAAPVPPPEPEAPAVPEPVPTPEPAAVVIPAPEPERAPTPAPAPVAPTPVRVAREVAAPAPRPAPVAPKPAPTAPEIDKEAVRRSLPPRLSQDERQACELLMQHPHGMKIRLLASRLNWSQSRADKIVNALIDEDVVLKEADEIRLTPKYKGRVRRG